MQKWLSVPAVIITCEGTINEGNSLADIRCRRFSDILRTKEDHYPYSDRYISEVHDSSTKTGRTEREHMVEWFRANETKGSGSYSRQTPNSSARPMLQQPDERCLAPLDRRGCRYRRAYREDCI